MRDCQDILAFWFEELTAQDWFSGDAALDKVISDRFGALYDELTDPRTTPSTDPSANPSTNHESWLATPEGSLALILVLDQFPRNLFRNSPRAFASDSLALRIANEAIARGHDLETHVERRVFFYLPYEHSEALADQDRAVSLIQDRADISVYLDYAERHRAVIARFGRFPHRNEILGRPSTAEETAYLNDGGERF